MKFQQNQWATVDAFGDFLMPIVTKRKHHKYNIRYFVANNLWPVVTRDLPV